MLSSGGSVFHFFSCSGLDSVPNNFSTGSRRARLGHLQFAEPKRYSRSSPARQGRCCLRHDDYNRPDWRSRRNHPFDSDLYLRIDCCRIVSAPGRIPGKLGHLSRNFYKIIFTHRLHHKLPCSAIHNLFGNEGREEIEEKKEIAALLPKVWCPRSAQGACSSAGAHSTSPLLRSKPPSQCYSSSGSEEGFLLWNHTFGKRILKALDACPTFAYSQG